MAITIMGNKNYISYLDIIDYIGIKKGDLILIASDIVKLMCVCRENGEKLFRKWAKRDQKYAPDVSSKKRIRVRAYMHKFLANREIP